MKTTLLLLLCICSSIALAQGSKKESPGATFAQVGQQVTPMILTANLGSAPATPLHHLRPLRINYKTQEWFLLAIEANGEKQLVYFTEEQLQQLASIVTNFNGETHYLQVTNFFEVQEPGTQTSLDKQFLSRLSESLRRRHLYRHNSLFMVSATTEAGQPVVRFKLPFANTRRVCRHLKAEHNLQSAYYQSTPEAFLGMFDTTAGTGTLRISAEE